MISIKINAEHYETETNQLLVSIRKAINKATFGKKGLLGENTKVKAIGN